MHTKPFCELEHKELIDRAFHEAKNGGVTEETLNALETPHGKPTWVIRIDPETKEVEDTIQTGSTKISEELLQQMGVACGKRVCQLVADGEFPEHLLNKEGEEIAPPWSL